MRTKHFLLLILSFALVVTFESFTCAQEKKTYPQITFSSNKTLHQTSEGVTITQGNELLITIKTAEGRDPRNDRWMERSLVFTIPEDSGNFEITDFGKHKAYVLISGCRCMDLGSNPVIKGRITGKRTATGLWHIEAEVTAAGKDSGEEIYFEYP